MENFEDIVLVCPPLTPLALMKYLETLLYKYNPSSIGVISKIDRMA